MEQLLLDIYQDSFNRPRNHPSQHLCGIRIKIQLFYHWLSRALVHSEHE